MAAADEAAGAGDFAATSVLATGSGAFLHAAAPINAATKAVNRAVRQAQDPGFAEGMPERGGAEASVASRPVDTMRNVCSRDGGGFAAVMSGPGSLLTFALAAAAVLAFASGCLRPNVREEPLPAARMPVMLPGPATTEPARPAREHLATALQRAAQDDTAGAVRAIESIRDRQERAAMLRELVATVATDDPARAGRIALAAPSGLAQSAAIESVASAMARRDADAAVQWALALPDAAPRTPALQAIGDHLVQNEPAAALGRLINLPAGARRDEAIGVTAARWARRDADAALAWARDQPPGELRVRVLTTIGFELAQARPNEAIALAESLPEGRNRWLLLSAATQTWVARDPNAALAWVRQLPAGAARETALAAAETSLASPPRQPALARGNNARRRPIVGGQIMGGAGESVDPTKLPPGPERDRALRKHFEQLLLMSPALAADWLSSLAPAERSDEMVDRMVREWLPQNPAAAELWIDQNIEQPDRKRELLRELRR